MDDSHLVHLKLKQIKLRTWLQRILEGSTFLKKGPLKVQGFPLCTLCPLLLERNARIKGHIFKTLFKVPNHKNGNTDVSKCEMST